MNIPILRNHDHLQVIGLLTIEDGKLIVRCPRGLTREEFFAAFGNVGVRFTGCDGDRIHEAQIIEFSVP